MYYPMYKCDLNHTAVDAVGGAEAVKTAHGYERSAMKTVIR